MEYRSSLGLDNRKGSRGKWKIFSKKIGLQDKKRCDAVCFVWWTETENCDSQALVTRPRILADEPTGNLDSQTELEVMSRSRKAACRISGSTLIMITHDETIAQMADEMIIIEDGKAVRR